MRPAVGVECPEAEISVLVNVAPVFGAQREVFGEPVINSDAIQEGTFRLGISAGHEAAGIARRVKHQTAPAAQEIRIELGYPEGKTHNHIGCGCVHIGLNSGKTPAEKYLWVSPS
jgi:hypothetical protein